MAIKCEFCDEIFDGVDKRNEHELTHFQQISCAKCNGNLIRIGGSWYKMHDDTHCTDKKEQDVLSIDDASLLDDDEINKPGTSYEIVDRVDLSIDDDTILLDEDGDDEINKPGTSSGFIAKFGRSNDGNAKLLDDDGMNTPGTSYEIVDRVDLSIDDDTILLDEDGDDEINKPGTSSGLITEVDRSNDGSANLLDDHEINTSGTFFEQIKEIGLSIDAYRHLLNDVELNKPGTSIGKVEEAERSNGNNANLNADDDEMNTPGTSYEIVDRVDLSIDDDTILLDEDGDDEMNKPGTSYEIVEEAVLSIDDDTILLDEDGDNDDDINRPGTSFRIFQNRPGPNAAMHQCNICDTMFKNADDLKEHQSQCEHAHKTKVAKIVVYACKQCTMTFPSESALATHKLRHMKKSYPCKGRCSNCRCKCIFTDQQSLDKHINDIRSICLFCGKQTRDQDDLLEHMRSHNLPCPYGCKIIYTHECKLRAHLISHHNFPNDPKAKEFHCKICDKLFLSGVPDNHECKDKKQNDENK